MNIKARTSGREHYRHVEGLRAVAALLVAVYHIYLSRVSGGVDVFFVISGLLITLSLIRRTDDYGRVDWRSFLAGLGLRLLPAAGVVLLLTLVASWYLLPASRYYETMREILASFLYFENWQLAFQSVDYLDRENAQSPVQHFWAMSVQGQFYLITLLLMCASYGLRVWSRGRGRDALGILLALALGFSLVYSIYQTHFGNQVWAYYDTFARYWEFAIGALLALALTRRPDLSLPPFFGWLGLVAIMLCGLVFQVGSVFPGAAALFPTAAAVLIFLGGRSGSGWSVSRLLGARFLVSLGSVAYGIYLFHWPILVFYREVAGTQEVGLTAGLGIIASSIGLAYALHFLIERRFLQLRSLSLGRRLRGIGIAATLPAVAITASFGYLVLSSSAAGPLARQAHGAAVLDGSATWSYALRADEVVPDLVAAKRDLPRSYGDGCHLMLGDTQVRWCVYGAAEEFRGTIAVVGGSHSAHWLPALERIAEEEKWRIMYSTWSGCRLMLPSPDQRCESLVAEALAGLVKIEPELVFTTANVGAESRPSFEYIQAWAALGEAGLRVVAVRDNPWVRRDVPDCVSNWSDRMDKCGVSRDSALSAGFDSSMLGQHVDTVDLSNYFCNEEFCPPIIGGVLVYRDGHHLTATFAASAAGVLREKLQPKMEARGSASREKSDAAVTTIVHGTLSCSALRRFGPTTNEVSVAISGAQAEVRRGDWQEREGAFDHWLGQVSRGKLVLTGQYRAAGGGPTNEVYMEGRYEGGELALTGTRGPRSCKFESSGTAQALDI